MDKKILAYCAGVVDSDGCVTIKKRKLKVNGKSDRITCSPSVFVRQVEIGAVDLLHKTFGGNIRQHPPSTPGGRYLFHWEVTHTFAHAVAIALMPYLRIKKRQAEILCEFCKTVRQQGFRKPATWFLHIKGEPLLTVAEAAIAKNVSEKTVRQAIGNQTVPAVRIPDRTRCTGYQVMVPKRFWDSYTVTNRFRVLPDGYIAWRERLTAEIRNLNGPTRGIKTIDRRK